MKKLKNFIALPLLLIMPFWLWSQSGLEVGAFWLPQTYRLLNDDDINFLSYQQVPFNYVSSGISLSLLSDAGPGFSTGLIISHQGQRYIAGETTSITDLSISSLGNISLQIYKIPIMFQYKKSRYQKNGGGTGRTGVVFQIGPQLSIVEKVDWLNQDAQSIEFLDSQGNRINLLNAYKKNYISAAMSLGANHAISQSLSLHFMLRMDYALEDIENKNFSVNGELFFKSERLATTTTSISLQTGFALRLSKK